MLVANPDCRNRCGSTQSCGATALWASPVGGEFNEHSDCETKTGTGDTTATTQHRQKCRLFYLKGTSTTPFNA